MDLFEHALHLRKETGSRFHLILSADTFIYVGVLGRVFETVTNVLHSGGIFAFSVEHMHAPRYEDRGDTLHVKTAAPESPSACKIEGIDNEKDPIYFDGKW